MPQVQKAAPADKHRSSTGRFTKGNPRCFKPGQSGNPKGRPKYKTLSESVRALLEQPAFANRKGGPTLAEVIAEAVLKKARRGDVKAFEAVANRAEGRVPQTLNVNADITIEASETRREWAEKKLAGLMKTHRLSRAAMVKELRATGATKLLELLGEA